MVLLNYTAVIKHLHLLLSGLFNHLFSLELIACFNKAHLLLLVFWCIFGSNYRAGRHFKRQKYLKFVVAHAGVLLHVRTAFSILLTLFAEQ